MLKVKFRNSKKLLKVLGTVENILRRNKVENKLQYIKLENVNDKLCIIARNLYMRLRYYVEDVISIEGDSALYDYKTLISLLNVLDDEIEINNSEIRNKKCNYTIPSLDTEGYPEDLLPQIVNRKELNTENFVDGLNGVFCSTAKSEYEKVLSGIYIDGNKLVACDRNRLFIKQIDTELDKVILSKDMVNELLRLPFEEKMYMSIFGENVIFEDKNLYIASNFINGNYPKYEQFLPKEINNEIVFKNKDLEKALSLIMPVIDQFKNNCKSDISQDNMRVYVVNQGKTAETLIPIDVKNELGDKIINVMFNVNYLIDMLKVNGKDITMQIHNNSVGYTFKSGNAKQYIMPMFN